MSDWNAAHDDPPSMTTAEAAAWFVRTRDGMTQREENEFVAWLTVDPEHARAYDAVTAAWNACLAAYSDKDILAMRLDALAALSDGRRLCGDGD